MFDEDLFAYLLELLAEEITARPAPAPDPLPVDSWIARSVMQKAIRRGMTPLALRAAAQLMKLEPWVLWRRLLVTALEDLGPGEADLMARITAACRDKAWRTRHGEWAVAAELIAQACEGTRCQSANDLWNVSRNDPALNDFKVSLCEAAIDDLLSIAVDEARDLGERGAAILIAIGEDGGPAAPDHIRPDPAAVFDAFSRAGRFSHVAVSYQDAYRQTKLALAPLSLCLWPSSARVELVGQDDDLPPTKWAGDTPTWALDQYTRGGKAAIRRYVSQSSEWRAFALSAGVTDQLAAAGELLFRAEGARVTNRRQWSAGLDLYAQSQPIACFMRPDAVQEGLSLITRQLPLMDGARSAYITTNHLG